MTLGAWGAGGGGAEFVPYAVPQQDVEGAWWAKAKKTGLPIRGLTRALRQTGGRHLKSRSHGL